MTTQGALHYHAWRIVRTLPDFSEAWTVLSSTWTQAESATIKTEDEENYAPEDNTIVDWYLGDQCDCEQTPDVWTS